MQDQVIKGTGNSRYLKSSIPEDITLSELVALLRAGTFPVDLNGLNEEGIKTLGTPLNTATLLSNHTAHAYGARTLPIAKATTVNDILYGLSLIIGSAAPTEDTVGQLGQFYWDNNRKILYECVQVNSNSYTWEAINNIFAIGDTLTTLRTDLGDNWLLCNGDTIDKTEYPELYDKLKADISSEYYTISGISSNDLGNKVRLKTYNNMLVAVYSKGICWAPAVTGPWRTQIMPFLTNVEYITDIAYGNGKWMLTTMENTHRAPFNFGIYSTDNLGGEWMKVYTPPTVADGNVTYPGIEAIEYNGGRFVAISRAASLLNYTPLYSNNAGATWYEGVTIVLAAYNYKVSKLVYLGGRWIVIPSNLYGASNSQIYYTANPATNWTTVTQFVGTYIVEGFDYDEQLNYYYALCKDTTNSNKTHLFRTDDLSTWEDISDNFVIQGSNVSVSRARGYLRSYNMNLLTTQYNGNSSTPEYYPTTININKGTIVYSPSEKASTEDNRAVIFNDELVLLSGSEEGDITRIGISGDALSDYTLITVGGSNSTIFDIDTDGAGNWVAVGGKYNAATGNAYLYYSTDDAASWQAVTLSSSSAIAMCVKYANGTWLVGGTDGAAAALWTTADVSSGTWTRVSNTLTGYQIKSIEYNGGNWVATGATSSGTSGNGKIYTKTGSISGAWTETVMTGTTDMQKIYAFTVGSRTLWLALTGNTSKCFYAINTPTNWTEFTPKLNGYNTYAENSLGVLWQSAAYNDGILALCSGSNSVYSDTNTTGGIFSTKVDLNTGIPNESGVYCSLLTSQDANTSWYSGELRYYNDLGWMYASRKGIALSENPIAEGWYGITKALGTSNSTRCFVYSNGTIVQATVGTSASSSAGVYVYKKLTKAQYIKDSFYPYKQRYSMTYLGTCGSVDDLAVATWGVKGGVIVVDNFGGEPDTAFYRIPHFKANSIVCASDSEIIVSAVLGRDTELNAGISQQVVFKINADKSWEIIPSSAPFGATVMAYSGGQWAAGFSTASGRRMYVSKGLQNGWEQVYSATVSSSLYSITGIAKGGDIWAMCSTFSSTQAIDYYNTQDGTSNTITNSNSSRQIAGIAYSNGLWGYLLYASSTYPQELKYTDDITQAFNSAILSFKFDEKAGGLFDVNNMFYIVADNMVYYSPALNAPFERINLPINGGPPNIASFISGSDKCYVIVGALDGSYRVRISKLGLPAINSNAAYTYIKAK